MKSKSITILTTVLAVSFISNIAACHLEEGMAFERRGWESFQKGRYREALGFFDMSIHCNPADIYAYSMRNYCYKQIILENHEAILSLQREICKNHELIEHLQNDQLYDNEPTEELRSAMLANHELAVQLQEEIAKHDDLINGLRSEISQNKEDAEVLRNAIVENKEILLELKAQLMETRGIQDVLVKYGNNPDGFTAFHYAIKKGDINAVVLMIQHGADVNSKAASVYYPFFGSCGYPTALQQAVLADQIDIARILLENGAVVNATDRQPTIYDSNGFTALSLAACIGNPEMIHLLVEYGANIEGKSTDPAMNPKPPLHIAVEKGKFEAVIVLIELGAAINKGLLDAAAKLTYKDNPKNLELVKFLVEHGAKRDISRSLSSFSCPVIRAYIESKGC
jgi:ankyrin repeat protein